MSRILVIDDNEALARALSMKAEEGGDAVRAVTNGEDALKLMRSGFHPDVILVDVRLKRGERGSDFVRKLKVDPTMPFPVVVWTASVEELPDIPEGIPVVYKPVESDRLLALLHEVAAKTGEARP